MKTDSLPKSTLLTNFIMLSTIQFEWIKPEYISKVYIIALTKFIWENLRGANFIFSKIFDM